MTYYCLGRSSLFFPGLLFSFLLLLLHCSLVFYLFCIIIGAGFGGSGGGVDDDDDDILLKSSMYSLECTASHQSNIETLTIAVLEVWGLMHIHINISSYKLFYLFILFLI